MKTVYEIINYFEALYSLKAVYCWRANGQIMTPELIVELYHQEYKSNPNSQYNSTYYENKLKEGNGRYCGDCSGIFFPMSGYDDTAQGYYNACITKGSISQIDNSKACLVFKHNGSKINHIGFYCGNGYTIEMESSKTNCVKRELSKGTWTHYGIPKWIDYGSENSTIINAVDISHHNTITNWDLLAQQYKNIIIRIGYRGYSNGSLTMDKKFKEHISQVKAHNMNIGIYYYDQSINEQEAIEQAKWTVENLKGYDITYPIYIDSEYANSNHTGRADGISKEQRTKNIIAFCETIKSLGYKAGVYASDSWFKSMVNFDDIKQYEIWCARYSTNNPTISKYEAWQYGSNNFAFARGAIDVNYFYKDYANKDSNVVVEPSKWLESKQKYLITIIDAPKGLNVRKEPNTTSTKVGVKYNGDIIQTIAVTSNGWWKIGDNQYISGKYCKLTDYGVVHSCNKLFIHNKPDKEESTRINNERLVNGAKIKIKGLQNEMYNVSTSDGLNGWASIKYIKGI